MLEDIKYLWKALESSKYCLQNYVIPISRCGLYPRSGYMSRMTDLYLDRGSHVTSSVPRSGVSCDQICTPIGVRTPIGGLINHLRESYSICYQFLSNILFWSIDICCFIYHVDSGAHDLLVGSHNLLKLSILGGYNCNLIISIHKYMGRIWIQ